MFIARNFSPVAAMALAFLLIQPLAAQDSDEFRLPRVSGVVRHAATGEPVAGAKVTASNLDGGRTVRTDPSGAFMLQEAPVEGGRVCIRVARKHYLEGGSCRDAVNSGPTIDDIVISLVPTGAVSGVVRDMNRAPLPLIAVELNRIAYDENGNRTVSVTTTTRTDDRGAYRFYDIPPGRYHIAAGMWPHPSVTPLDVSRNDDINGVKTLRSAYPRRYYPDEEDPRRAPLVEIVPGGNVTGIDFFLPRQPVYRIRGYILDAFTGKPPGQINFALHPSGVFGAPPYRYNNRDASLQYNPLNGSFEISGVLPGSYVLTASPIYSDRDDAGRYGVLAPQQEQEKQIYETRVGSASIAVSNADVADVPVFIVNGASLSGKLIIDNQTSEGRHSSFVYLRPDMEDWPTVPLFAPYGYWVDANPFGLKHHPLNLKMKPGQYRLSVQHYAGAPDIYIKDARIGGIDIREGLVSISSAESGPIDIVLGVASGSVTGRVLNDRFNAAQNATVVLVPDRFRSRRDLYRTAMTDTDGAFEIKGVPPGAYRAYAWIEIEPNAYLNAEFMAPFETFGVPVEVPEEGAVTIALKVVPRN